MKSTLIIATYNWPEALNLVLESARIQTQLPDEIIIADDGSTKETEAIINQYKTSFSIPVHHIWQEDNGFRKSHILNQAIAKAKGDYIIQVDGDCIMHYNFVKDHLAFAASNTYLFGSRVNIQEPYLETLFAKKQIKFNPFSKGIKKRTRAIHSPILSSMYKQQDDFSKKFRGCNTSYFKSDFIAVNGYNEDITGWGREDSELMLRMHNKGVKAKRLRYRGIVFHIWHKEKSKDRVEANDSIEQKTINDKIAWADNGVDKYLEHA
ncbi:glycosyltransferase family 2 protein [uncultured Lacinutrix sp.]|uniref:glycosyltransferase family 2 protein n=1 Tax=uncultured Lacinutrix sp. TaxID=574032 RepID=UPI002606CFBA|nr:glycosyltransferase family 2 protein [uncultured Lacinutrix sp.]